MLERIAYAVDCVHELRDSLEGEELALNGHQDRVGRDQRVEREQIQGRRAIDQNEAVLFADVRDALTQAELAIGDSYQFEVRADQVLIGGNQVQPLKVGCLDRVPCGQIFKENLIEAGAFRILGNAQAGGGIALGVGVYEQNSEVISRQRGRQVNGGRGLTDPALLIGDGEYSAQTAILT
jgi:hypothetical protein